MKADLVKCLRVGGVPRWSIVAVNRTQSVAEHSYNVWLITSVLYDILYPTPHNSPEKQLTLEYALTHDLAETITGDIPTPAKAMIESINPGLLDKLEGMSLQLVYPQAINTNRAVVNTPGQAIVKLADHMEALTYIKKYGGACEDVEAVIKRSLWKHLDTTQKRYPQIEWVRAVNYIVEVFPELGGPDPMD